MKHIFQSRSLPLFSEILLCISLYAVNAHVQKNETSQICVSIFTEKNYNGYKINVANDVRWLYKRHLNLISFSVRVQPQCSLSVFDGQGTLQVLQQDTPEVVWPEKRPLQLACCQCGNCDEITIQNSLECARLYQYEKCNACIGSRMDLKDGHEANDFRTLEGKISSVAIRNGCNLVATYEILIASRMIMVKASLRNGDNLIEMPGLFSELTSVRAKKAECTCNMKHSSTEPDSLESTLKIPIDIDLGSSSSSQEFTEGDQSQSSEDQWMIYDTS